MTEGVLSFVRTWLLYAVAVYAFRRLGVVIGWYDESWVASIAPAAIIGTVIALVVTWMERRRGRAAQPGGGDER